MTRAAGQRGFTLAEALIALAILAIAASALISVFGSGSQRSIAQAQHAELQAHAAERLERLRAEIRHAPAPAERASAIDGVQIIEQAEFVADDILPSGRKQLFRLEVTASRSQRGRDYSYSLSGYVIAERAP